jgi:transmembrane sensor
MAERRSSVDGMRPGDAAAFWLARHNAGDMNDAERVAFDAWLAARPEHQAAYRRAQAAWDDAGKVASDPAIMRLREAALDVQPRGFRFGGGRAVAAIVAVALALGAVVGIQPDLREQAVAWIDGSQGVAQGSFQTAVGERSTVMLEDGSVATLNTNSKVEVAFSDGERRVRLIKGQAMFEVAKNPNRPFVVFAGDRRIVALGTAFDVRLDNDRVEVTLVEGRVAVEKASTTTHPGLTPMKGRTELEPGEQLVAALGEPMLVKAANTERVTSWRGGKLVFQDDALVDVVREVSRYSRTRIVIDDERIGQLRVSGVFRTGQADNFAKAITEFFPLAVEERGANESALVWRKNARP